MSSVVILSSCAKDIPDNNGEFHGTSIRLNRDAYGESQSYNEGKVGSHAICNGAFEWGRNFGNSWSFNEFDNANIKHYDKYYTDSIGYIEFGEFGIGRLKLVNQDSIHIDVPFTYEIVGKNKSGYYYQINWEDVKVRTYVQYDNGGSPLMSFGYQDMGDGLFVWEGSMSEFSGVYLWGGNYISWFNNDFTCSSR